MRHVDTLNLNLCILNTFYPGISSPEDVTTEKDENIVCLNELVTLHTAVSERRLITDDIINVQDYAAIDDEANVHECTEGTADEIVEELLSKSNAKEVLSEEVEGPLDEKLTYSEAITMIRKLQRYSFQKHPDIASTLLQIESNLEVMEAEKRIRRSHQSSILDYLTVGDK
ncbi:hypothetical protein T05_11426 [Trichinella murrelli]|uniref:Uncharacterized protein n=1 Tax=Trichinella murrelli TaxID=144512 RepID=A0A0V0TEV6_9BILA|nr:hypothetical protein T05_11426 [Trichinella murrelli]